MKPEIIICDQGTPEWLKLKLGVISASNISKVLAKRGSDTRNGYMAELVGQVCTGEQEEINAKALEWGRVNEDSARAAYSFKSGLSVEKVGFIYKDQSRRSGCSPDLKVTGKNKFGEIKVPMATRVYIEFLASGKIKKDYMDQVMFSMWVTGAEEWDFINYNPRMKSGEMLYFETIERNPIWMQRFDDAVPEFISEMDSMLERIGVKWGSQW